MWILSGSYRKYSQNPPQKYIYMAFQEISLNDAYKIIYIILSSNLYVNMQMDDCSMKKKSVNKQ